jgi:hypothetical protein
MLTKFGASLPIPLGVCRINGPTPNSDIAPLAFAFARDTHPI